MLGFYPTPYPDELLYSLIARYHIRSGSTSPKITLSELFGSTTTIATIDLPANLNNLTKRLQHLTPNLASDLIDKHTLYPFYQTFLPPQRDRSIRQSMKASRAANIHTRAGIMASAIPVPRYLRFCPQCNSEDLELYGELYWHRLHQIPGVLVCPKHGVFLQASSIPTQGFNRHQYHAASLDNCQLVEQYDTYRDRTREQLQLIALDILWLLNRNLPAHAPEYFQRQYRSLLIDRGLANSNGRVYQDRIQTDFRSFYDREVLTLLDSTVEENCASNWLVSITRKHHKSFHPIRHLLFIRFLNDTVSRFFRDNYQYQPFGKAPWICLNAVASHYRQSVVMELKVSHCLENKQPLGVFTCECGMIYCRTGPDRSEEDKYKIGKIIAFGELWEEKLRELVEQQKLGLRAVARELNVDTRTVKRYVLRLQLVSHWEKRSQLSIEPTEPPIAKQSPIPTAQREYWMSLQQQYPQATKTELRKISPATYAWLYRKDREWLNNNSPVLQQPVATGERVDWGERDLDVLDRVKASVDSILQTEIPVRVTMSRIGKSIGLSALLEQHLDLMPMTRDYLTMVTESIDDFQIRRIRWAVNELDRRGKQVLNWRVMRLAGLGEDVSDLVGLAIEQEISSRS
ncbi:MAG: TnsD family transposase [Chamaesiphon sp.]|nr:TnsD family transposase [Chamaesiphon sp.]